MGKNRNLAAKFAKSRTQRIEAGVAEGSKINYSNEARALAALAVGPGHRTGMREVITIREATFVRADGVEPIRTVQISEVALTRRQRLRAHW